MTDSGAELTRLLVAAGEGDADALERAFPLVYELLRVQAARLLRGERSGHTLQATALVHEAWLKLSAHGGTKWQDRAHFRCVAAKAMRRILVDHARRRKRQKRCGEGKRLSLEVAEGVPDQGGEGTSSVDVVALDEAMINLAAVDPRLVRTVELRYFGGLSVEETAEALGVGTATVKRDWILARAWLRRALDDSQVTR